MSYSECYKLFDEKHQSTKARRPAHSPRKTQTKRTGYNDLDHIKILTPKQTEWIRLISPQKR